ncbi:MAG: TonB-dependent receptor [Rhodocyclaceae bacterium]|nr:TonB-dependent receptor [Rhodocyclaceae bacterium]
MSFKRVTLAAAIAALPFTIQAADTALSEVVVKASRDETQFATTVGAASIQSLRSATSDTASLLRDVPGVSFYGAGGVSSLPAIHGLADDRLRIKVDGADMVASCPNHMNPPLSYVDPTNVGEIKVYAGITPVSVGGDSIGGTIVVNTSAPTFAAPGQGSLVKGEAGAFYRSNGDAWGANLAATYASESFSLNYAGATAESGNYTASGNFKNYDFTGRVGHTLSRDEVGSTAYKTRNHTLGMAFKGGNHLFEAKLGYQDLPYQLYPNQRMDMLDNEQTRLNLRYLGQFDWGKLEARAYHENLDHFMDFGADKRYWYGSASGGGAALNGTPCSPYPSAACATGMPMYTTSKTDGASVKADVELSQKDLLRIGAELHRYRLDDWWPPSGGGMFPGTFWNIKDGARDRTALFAEWEAQASKQWTTLVGVRYERVKMDAGDVRGYNPVGGGNQGRDAGIFNALDRSRTDNNWDFTALTKYTASATQDIEFGFARKVRSPGLYELYPWSTWQMAALMNNFVGDGNGYVGNPDLKSEKAHALSATFDWHAADRAWEFKATPYYTRVTDYIDARQWNATTNAPSTVPVTNGFAVLRYVNQAARLYGIDLSGKMPLAKTGIGEFGLKGLLNYTNGKNRDTGDDLYNIMPLNAKLTLTHKYGGWDNAIELAMVKSKDNVSAARNEIKTPGYNLVNLRASYSWKQARVDFGVENLLDKFYYLPTGGAYTGQGTTMSNPALPNYPQWGTAVPGMGRSLYAGMNVKF